MTDLSNLLFKKPSPCISNTGSGDSGKNKNARVLSPSKPSGQGQGDSYQMEMPASPPGATYEHRRQVTKLEDINKYLNEIKEKLTKTSVQCHMLQVDLVSLYNPHAIQALKKTKDACKNCAKTVESLDGELEMREKMEM